MINTITPEQEAKIPEYLEKYNKIGTNTSPCDRARAEAAVSASYAYLKFTPPTFVWADSPFQGARLAAQLAKGCQDVTEEEISDQRNKASFGSFEAYWVAFYDFVSEQLPVKHDPLIDIVKEIVATCGVYWTFDGKVVMTERPIAIHFQDKKLHNPNGLALEYKDGTGVFSVEGKLYPSLLDMVIQNEIDATEVKKKGKSA